MEVNKSLYKLDSKGKVRILTISTDKGKLMQESGLLDGKRVTHTSTSKPKNVGRSNETNATEQAVLEAESKLKKKLDEGYFETIKEAENEVVVLPMLAKSYGDEQHKIDWSTAYVQPKLDGMRCLKNNNGMRSRQGKEITTLPHISALMPHITDYLDGEIYSHGDNFQKNMKLIKKNREDTIKIKYHVYDMVLPMPFSDRYALLKAIVENDESKDIVLVPTHKVSSFEEVVAWHRYFIENGYEGTMVRWGDDGYKKNGRSSNLLKYKDFLDITCPVVDILPSERRPEQGVIQCEIDGKQFGCGMRFTHYDREDMLLNKQDYIGQMAEIRFFEYSDDGIPRFPVCVGFRLDKN